MFIKPKVASRSVMMMQCFITSRVMTLASLASFLDSVSTLVEGGNDLSEVEFVMTLTFKGADPIIVAVVVPIANLVLFDGKPGNKEETPKRVRLPLEMDRLGGLGIEEFSGTGGNIGGGAMKETFEGM